jgi:cyclophilin family peptidyl-prolyl cis-trans isomerase
MRIVRSGLFVVIFCAALSARAQSVPTLNQPFPSQTLAPDGVAVTIDIRNHITVPGVTGTKFAKFDTVFGSFSIELRDDVAPRHVANFLTYANSAAYTNSFFHRSGFDITENPSSLIQGGGYRLPLLTEVTKNAPVPLEYNLPNARGTIAAARTSDINSASSEWYFNVRDNSTTLNQQNGGGYTVFGAVLGNGMTVVDRIAALPRVSIQGAAALGNLPVRDYNGGGSISEANLVLVNSVREATLFPTGGGTSVIELSVQNSASTVVTTLLSGSTLTLTPVSPGTATITVRAADANGGSAEASFTVTVANTAPAFTGQPQPQTVAVGSTLVLNAPASGAPSYVWTRDGIEVPGAVTDTLVLRNITTAQAGTYVAQASNSFGTITSQGAAVSVVTTTNPGRLINLSILTPLAAGDTMTMGTVLGGSGTSGAKPLLARGAGPSLAQLGVTGFLPDPTVTLFSGNTAVATNNDWAGNTELSAAFTQAGAFPYTDASSKDAAIFQSALAPGNYTVQVKDTGTGNGTVIAELYDSSGVAYTASTPRLINVSVLKPIANGSVLTAGFVVGGSTSKTVLIRAVGPTLGAAPFGLGGVLADPQLKLFNAQQNVIASNDDWGGSLELMVAAENVGAFRLAAGTSKDAVLLLTLPPGSYSAQISGANNTGGTAIVEVYEVP